MGLLVLLFSRSYLYGVQKTAMLDLWQWDPLAAPDSAPDSQALCSVPRLARAEESTWAGHSTQAGKQKNRTSPFFT